MGDSTSLQSPSPAVSSPSPAALLTVTQVAERTSSSQSHWRREIRLHRIRVYRLGDLVRISEADLAAYLAERAQ